MTRLKLMFSTVITNFRRADIQSEDEHPTVSGKSWPVVSSLFSYCISVFQSLIVLIQPMPPRTFVHQSWKATSLESAL